MDISILFVKVIAVYFVISGAFLILRGKTLPIILKDFFDHPAIGWLTGVVLIFLGAGVIVQKGPAESSVEIWAKVLGWIVLLKGIAYIFIPKIMAKISLKKLDSWFGVCGIIMMLLGVYLLFLA